MEVTEKDVWVVTYPRSGTTWTQEMVWNILNGLDFEKAKRIDIDDKFFFLDMDFLKSESHGEAPGFVEKANEAVGKQRLIKTHLPIGLLPAALLTKCKVSFKNAFQCFNFFILFVGDICCKKPQGCGCLLLPSPQVD